MLVFRFVLFVPVNDPIQCNGSVLRHVTTVNCSTRSVLDSTRTVWVTMIALSSQAGDERLTTCEIGSRKDTLVPAVVLPMCQLASPGT